MRMSRFRSGIVCVACRVPGTERRPRTRSPDVVLISLSPKELLNLSGRWHTRRRPIKCAVGALLAKAAGQAASSLGMGGGGGGGGGVVIGVGAAPRSRVTEGSVGYQRRTCKHIPVSRRSAVPPPPPPPPPGNPRTPCPSRRGDACKRPGVRHIGAQAGGAASSIRSAFGLINHDQVMGSSPRSRGRGHVSGRRWSPWRCSEPPGAAHRRTLPEKVKQRKKEEKEEEEEILKGLLRQDNGC
ncbi:unnamed protein product [Merluccius merluccius]